MLPLGTAVGTTRVESAVEAVGWAKMVTVEIVSALAPHHDRSAKTALANSSGLSTGVDSVLTWMWKLEAEYSAAHTDVA